jgi:hypothetical protein
MHKPIGQIVCFDSRGRRTTEFTIDVNERSDLVAKRDDRGHPYTLPGFRLSDEIIQWIQTNVTSEYRTNHSPQARYLHLWFASERDATLFKTFFG